MDKRLQQICSTKLHYKNGIVKLALYEEAVFGIIHSYEKVAIDLYEVFILYKAYERFIDENGWHLLLGRFALEYGISLEGKSLKQLVKAINGVQEKLLKEMESNG